MKLWIDPDNAGKWRWRVMAGSRVLAEYPQNREGYSTKSNAVRGSRFFWGNVCAIHCSSKAVSILKKTGMRIKKKLPRKFYNANKGK